MLEQSFTLPSGYYCSVIRSFKAKKGRNETKGGKMKGDGMKMYGKEDDGERGREREVEEILM